MIIEATAQQQQLPSSISMAAFTPDVPSLLMLSTVFETAIGDVNADPNILPNITLKAEVLFEGRDQGEYSQVLDYAHQQLKTCVTLMTTDAEMQEMTGPIAAARNPNHGFLVDYIFSRKPWFNEFGTSFGLLGWAQIVDRFLDMTASLDIKRFAVVMPKSFEPMAKAFLTAEKTK